MMMMMMSGRKVLIVFALFSIVAILADDVVPTRDLKDTPCAPGDFFRLECNTCYCNSQGTGYLCTDKLCQFGTTGPASTSSISPGAAVNGSITVPVGQENQDELDNNTEAT